MENFLPNSFIEVLGGIVIALSLILCLVSLIPVLRSHSIKLLGLFVVVAISLFSNHWSTYFAGIFVVATAVTELEFLQNLAAIIRGNKEYFDYKKESLSSAQKQEKIEEEQKQISEAQPTEEKVQDNIFKIYRATVTTSRSDVERIFNIEEKALDKMEEYFNSKIERGVGVSRKGNHIKLDGLIPSIVDDMFSEKIIEVKYLKSPINFSTIRNILPSIEHLARTYSLITNKIAKLHIVLVIEGDQELNEKQLHVLKQLIDSSNIAMGYSVFTTRQLDIE